MKSYADVDYYNNEFCGDKIITDEKDLIEKLILASQKIDEITYNRIVGKGFNNLTKFQQLKIKEAVCFQANYIFENGCEASDITSYGVIDINVSVGEKTTEAQVLNVSAMAYSNIKQTGLRNGIL